MQDGCIVHMDFFIHGIKWIVFHGHLTIFNNHLLEIGLTPNQEIVPLRTLTTVDLLHFYHL